MNKERILELADLVEKEHIVFDDTEVTFDMSNVLEGSAYCGTHACLAGLAFIHFGSVHLYTDGLVHPVEADDIDIEHKAREYLGLNSSDAMTLFYGVVDSRVTGKEAAAVLRKFAETGIIDWSDAAFRLYRSSKHFE